MYQRQLPNDRGSMNPVRAQFMTPTQLTNNAPQGGGGFMSGAAGDKMYGTGRPAPRYGKIANKEGYAMRDARKQARMGALQRRVFGV